MVKALELYLVTNNNGLEAVDFYKDVFDAEVVSCTTVGQAIPNTPEEKQNLVLNAHLNIDGIRLQLSDNGSEHAYIQGTNMTACIQLDNVEEAKAIYGKLAESAQRIDLELAETPWSPAYGIVVDKFGMTWQINTDIAGFVSENVTF
ncbi:VOC family protein [Streptococcus gallinaceus]|uniref:PhnB protein n=1 Tax=Streptococcus gallinaceus TaxID=165758 RepID=A0ABV2JMP5_9STRE|nr:VOC family protein [Streptococcus gallinaceus]MCP1640037.1 PhnB protein [Streptococcus gallinaceus]MCP1770819.1 PhnB protein [Streptococcus gallinaceus]